MAKTIQRILLALGVVALVALLTEIGLAVAATQHGSTPARVAHVNAGPYSLVVSLYQYPANAGFALPFAIAPASPAQGNLSFYVLSVPGNGVSATPVRASLNPDSTAPGGAQGAAEVPVQGHWNLHIVVDGPQGQGVVDVPIIATAPPAIPQWLGWLIGFIPLCGLLVFILFQRRPKMTPALSTAA